MTTQTASKRQPNKLFIPIQQGVFEHIADGRMTINMWAIYSVMLKEADYNTGTWMGCAEKARAAWNYDLPLRTAQRTIQALCDRQYVKSFRQNGQRKNQPFLIHKYPVRFGPNKGKMLNAISTTDPEYPVYENDSRQDYQGERDDAANVPASTPQQESSIEFDRDTSTYSLGPYQRPQHDHVSDGDTTASATAPKHPVDLASIPEVPEVLDFPEIERIQEQHQHQHQTGTVAGVDDTSPSSNNENHGQENTKDGWDRESFLREQANLLHEAGVSKTTATHLDQSCETAQKVGTEPYFAALRLWLRHDSEEDLTISQKQDEVTGKWKTQRRSWPLKTFLDSTSLPAYVARARPFFEQYRATGELLDFLTKVDPGELPEQFSQSHVDKLRMAIKEHGPARCEMALDGAFSGEEFFDDPLGVTKQHREVLNANRNALLRAAGGDCPESVRKQ